jgi:hypothetical protein
MDFFQGVVVEYLRAHRSVFVNPELLIQLDEGELLGKGRHWYCDAAAASFQDKTLYLCEISYSQTLSMLIKRLQSWADNWDGITTALARNSNIPADWIVRPWVFIPKKCRPTFDTKVARIVHGKSPTKMPDPGATHLELVAPWEFKRTWDRKGAPIEASAPDSPEGGIA